MSQTFITRRGGIGKPVPKTPNISYTGNYDIFRSLHPTTGSERLYMALYTSGTLTSDINAIIDLFIVNGGYNGGGTPAGVFGASGGNGGAGGNLENYYNIGIVADFQYSTVIGSSNGFSSFQELLATKSGGLGGAGAGGTNGRGVDGSSATILPFEGLVLPFNNMKFSGGGGGGGVAYAGVGGAGGGGSGSTKGNGSSGIINTGGGGGGSQGMPSSTSSSGAYYGGAGGSGIILIRWGDWTV